MKDIDFSRAIELNSSSDVLFKYLDPSFTPVFAPTHMDSLNGFVPVIQGYFPGFFSKNEERFCEYSYRIGRNEECGISYENIFPIPPEDLFDRLHSSRLDLFNRLENEASPHFVEQVKQTE
jgi:hypothetical protein